MSSQQHHTDLMGHGFTHAEATQLLGLGSLNAAGVLAWLKAHGPAAVKLLKAILPILVSDPAALAALQALINGWLAGQQPAPATP